MSKRRRKGKVKVGPLRKADARRVHGKTENDRRDVWQ
jgi:hypothetical protein